MKHLPPIAIILLCGIAASANDSRAALEDRSRFPQSEWGYLYYLTTSECESGLRADLTAAIKLMVASTSRQPIVERCTPVQVTDTLMRIDLRDLHWRYEHWVSLLREYPYDVPSNGALPLTVRADWLLVRLADSTESKAYYNLLYGRVPKDRTDFLALHDVQDSKGFDPLRFGLIEAESGVAKQETRWIESFPSRAPYYWATRDVLRVQPDFDPLEHPLGDFKHDGEEHIAALPKVHLESGARGSLQAYALFNGQGALVQEAPVDLVEDSTAFRGNRAIVNPGSCVQCHGAGINKPTTNDFRRLVADGVDVYAYRDTQEHLEAFHLGQVEPYIKRNQEDFQTIVPLITGVDSIESAKAFKRAINEHDRPLTPVDAARELHCEPGDLQMALGWYMQPGRSLAYPARLAGLAHGRTIPRETWESGLYRHAQELVRSWLSRN